jgi:6-phosphogluconolactonase
VNRLILHSSTLPAADWLAGEVAAQLSGAVGRHGAAWLVVSGGQSPRPVYERLSQAVLDWSLVTVSLTDERLVPRSHEDRNESMVRESLMKGAASRAHWLDIADNEGQPESSLLLATRELTRKDSPPSTIILGMGMDGHVLSWFPEAPETPSLMQENAPLVGLCTPGNAPWKRITLGWPLLAACTHVFLWLGSHEKTMRFRELFWLSEPRLPVMELVDRLGDRLSIVGVDATGPD